MLKIQKGKITKEKIDINFKFYNFIKKLNSTDGLSESLLKKFFEIMIVNKNEEVDEVRDMIKAQTEKINNSSRRKNIDSILNEVENEIDLDIFSFSLKLLIIRPLLFEEAKLIEDSKITELSEVHPLSLEYDKISKYKPYYARVNGALLSLLFFEKLENDDKDFIAEASEDFIRQIFSEYKKLKKAGVEPNQIFMIMFNESINQSIISDAGVSYEDRLLNVLISLGIKKEQIEKIHDEDDKSTEFDFFFTLGNKKYGIGAKRTLRERYKQFIKTAKKSSADVFIEVTLGTDLSEQKTKSIRNYSVYLFVADEIYERRPYLKSADGVYPASQMTKELLESLR
jgi:hypothetical protein